ncbi:MAG TPA: hypothetical protein PKL37_18155, partial [Panacibacter sp.]|nr:hypothetical protein [Panacibacter sp.]
GRLPPAPGAWLTNTWFIPPCRQRHINAGIKPLFLRCYMGAESCILRSSFDHPSFFQHGSLGK